MDELLVRELTPAVIGVLVDRGVDLATAEDAVQEALIQAALTWPDRQPADPKGWLVTVAWRKFLDARRSEASRRDREQRVEAEPPRGPTETADDTLQLFFLCAHPSLTPASAVALTLRAVGGLTTRQIAQAYLVPEATMAQRISRAKRTVGHVRFEEPGDLATVLRVLYLVFNEGYTGEVDLAAEAIRLTRQLSSMTDAEETARLRALMLLHHARRPARTRRDGSLVSLAEQDRSRWNTSLIAKGVAVLQTALGRDRLCEFQAQAAIAALHADAPRALACLATPPPRRTFTRRRATFGPRHGCMPTPPGPPPTWPNVTTSPGRQRGSVKRCASESLVNHPRKTIRSCEWHG